MLMNKDTHVYCTDCKNYHCNLDCAKNDGDNSCDICPCNNCGCEDAEDSIAFELRPKYVVIK